MKRILIIVTVLFSLSTIIRAQQTENTVQLVGLAGSASIIEYSVKGYLEPFLAWGTGKKQLVLAPTVLIGTNLGYQSPQSPRLTGARFGYRFWPGSLDKKWNFYLSVDVRLQRIKDVWEANLYNEAISDYQQYQVKSVELSIENYLGYGLEYNISKQLSLGQGVGLGWYLSDLSASAAIPNVNLVDLVDYRGYDDVGFIWNVSFGIYYRLVSVGNNEP